MSRSIFKQSQVVPLTIEGESLLSQIDSLPPHTVTTPQSFEPMRQNRFMVIFPERLGISEYMVKSTSRPSCKFIDSLIQWDDIVFDFYDPIEPSICQSIFNLINNGELLGDLALKIQMLGPVGDLVSSWLVHGFVKEVNFGKLSYNNGGFTEISLTMGVDYAILEY